MGSEQEPDVPRRTVLSLLPGLITTLTAIGVFSYAFIYAYLVSFYLQLGLFPSAAGLSQSEILSRATWPVVTLSILLLLAAGILVAAGVGLRRVAVQLDRVTSGGRWERPLDRIRHVFGGAFGVALVAAAILSVTISEWTDLLELVVFTLLLWPLARLIETRGLPRSLLALVTAAAMAGYLLPSWGAADADRFKKSGEIQGRSFLLGVEMQYVIPEKSETPPPVSPGRVYVMLGASGNIIVLYDCRNRNVYRMYIGSVLLRGHAFSPDSPQADVAARACITGRTVPDLP